jgi:uncharacterized protein YxjI
MREKLVSIGDDFWIEDEQGNRAYRVDRKAAREVARRRKLSVRDKMAIERDGETIATVVINDVAVCLQVAAGSKYEIERDGATIARVSKRWFRMRDTYGVELPGRRGRGHAAGGRRGARGSHG